MPDWIVLLAHCQGFLWDDRNDVKNWESRLVSQADAEQVFFNRPDRIAQDIKRSLEERRYAVLGKTDRGRRLAIVFTIRGDRIRVISARDMSRGERRLYEQET